MSFILHNPLQSKENKLLVDEMFQSMRGTLQSCLRSDGTPRPATSAQQVATANKQCTPIQGSVSKLQLVTKSDVEDYIIGDQVYQLY
jgi:hypothetical protein